MPTWKAYFQINGYDYSRYPVIDFPVPEDLYAGIRTALSKNRPLRDCPFYEKLQDLASAQISLEDYLPDWMEEPDPAEYDDEESYAEELDSYEEQREEYMEVLNIDSCAIDDPGDIRRLENQIRGLRLPDPEIRLENEDCTRLYWITVTLDEDNRVEEVVDVQAEGVAGESARSVSTELCYPDYEFIAAELKRLAEEEA